MPDQDPDRTSERRVDLGVIQYQVGALQTALDRGIGSLERTMEKGFESVETRLDRFEGRLKTIEERQAFDAARLKALEEFRAEMDRREDERRKKQEMELQVAVDNSAAWKTARWIGITLVSLISAVGVVVGIISALH